MGKQHTLKKICSLKGKGLHKGKDVSITFHPADINHGIVFKRTDLEENNLIPASAESVVEAIRGTVISNKNGAVVRTIEHVMAALAGLAIDNVLIEIDNEEVPIVDGSSIEYVKLFQQAGIVEQDADKNIFELKEVITWKDSNSDIEIMAIPSESFKVSVLVDYKTKVLGMQHAELNNISDFAKEIAPARTFCFLHEILPLINANMIKGGDVENAIVYVNNILEDKELQQIATFFNRHDIKVENTGILNNISLHFDNEVARHKLLDLIGDLNLIGYGLKAHIIAKYPGHATNTAFALMMVNKIKEEQRKVVFDVNKPPIFNSVEIKQKLPHRFPFLLVDKIIELTNERVVGIKNATINEEFFNGHFPQEPVMPGVLLVEGMAQTGGVLVLNQVPDPENYLTFFLSMDKVKFRAKVSPGDTVVYEMILLEPIRRGLAHMKGKAYVNQKVVAEGDFLAQIVKEKE
ncbi:MAG TPA: bifunctional UDP-3-O-[3-hydroxymyristoyl] N-acetylglucosamine deacetylase/3-hydroxyacyl-ACP dehydratase [Bacteroidales bacterium]|jgi:UDP-3-O-[3-hydroxymyristoyl] N-acetylglucosamine deacetylase/3-hydroxyacyl-[acyl-carrier-protein] dehydratase|nr:bifunctional UDP-3-O-[3-hydroxymyristoyl] N-acetylglucosamine deacetylase/3-hydroxyacyl-ACP dehydratase [Bacteroidales bacterium]HOR81955.1 bifunctional UDP-3-O-[3-hydroxymyristoyl] N-acetylglucosamine deacetylase/3-hydroxyacyl-ACP dehydratase [Bacteroidales bacterium]HPJ91478.1 bifunctional UDP-3-O-[3-hydroxymyristoyl] N-acetylglucosamine deacetylase/3-hydroxyacyl-ACP dehydratase [Bacteroidales bacterium]HQB20106.1 bifunctional UDP-3-O-[3-hydroxymyristoyl] N-acetylglucosamine deacetylase/3-h